MKQKSLLVNVVYNFIYTGLNLLFPLITAPYVSRILGASNLGKVNFAAVIVNWFVLFAIFGTSTYGVREVAKVRDNKEKLNKLFSEIVLINGALSLIVAVVYYVFIFNVPQFSSEISLFVIMSLSIILNMFDIDWFYQGIEEYRYITIRSAFFKIISLICIFIFINKAEHYIIYGLISVLATGLSWILNYIYSRKFVKLNFRNINPLRHIKTLSIFFMHTFVVSIYTNIDQALLGFLVNTKSVAFMNRSKTVVGMAISVSTAISNVTLPRASYYLRNDKKKFRQLLSEVPNFISWITIPISFACICLAPNIMYILGGKEFLQATFLLQVLSLTIIFSPLSSFLQNQVLIASGKEKIGLHCAIITSFLSLIFNSILIPKIGFLGAGITQVIAEISAVSMRYYVAKKKLDYKEIKFINKSSISYVFSAFMMSAIVIYICSSIDNLIISFAVSAIVGAMVYFIVLLLMKEKVMMFVIGKVKQKFVR
ncbi:flippase [Clostridium lacusfryxellense]|uniref:flippase n=1 Tax=Clostridium lacusfryxellense TaxID=205328 RepID=UPI001C0D6C60|nr:flippase [Clostridium lacusfryxellense]MBU3111043.1 flippase [Clostridium lacusfryxellense]